MTLADGTPLDLTKLKADKSWSFADCTQSQTRYITHGYHTYPAKFIPQLAARLIDEFSRERDLVIDPFMGSGTTVVEALMLNRIGVGVDINPVAHLIAKTKATPILPSLLKEEYAKIESDLQTPRNRRASGAQSIIPANERIDYWFPKKQKTLLGFILGRIGEIENGDVRDFFLVAFSQILKSTSIWLQKSIKPTRDPDKTPAEPIATFLRQSRSMLKRNEEFWNRLPDGVKHDLESFRIIERSDARLLPLEDGLATLVVTSPPYVTSYEYADLHQLSALWLAYCDSLPEFRKQFIGTAFAERATIDLQSKIAEQICASLGTGKKAQEVRNYFADMLECFQEMFRVLTVGGKACIVIGNTELQGTPILNAQVFIEQMHNSGFGTHKIVKREIPSKILPQTRDPISGKFTSAKNAQKILAYPVEYILVMEKLG
jgi:DNA modification methylase